MVFGDVNLSENPIRERHGVQFNPGAGGWPTIRYFNADTGPGGAPYEKVTDKAMCEELKDEDNMFAYVEKAASTSLCSLDGQGCSDKQKTYIAKWTGKRGRTTRRRWLASTRCWPATNPSSTPKRYRG